MHACSDSLMISCVGRRYKQIVKYEVCSYSTNETVMHFGAFTK